MRREVTLKNNGLKAFEILVLDRAFGRDRRECDEYVRITLSPGEGGIDGQFMKIKEEVYS